LIPSSKCGGFHAQEEEPEQGAEGDDAPERPVDPREPLGEGGGSSISPRAGWSPLLGSAPMRILVTGGCGFIGSNFIRYILQQYKPAYITNVDALTYAGNLANLDGIVESTGNATNFSRPTSPTPDQMDTLLHEEQCYAIINFAAESHVDRSINSPQNFIHTNVVGTSVLLNAARRHGVQRFIQVSTDEVYGSLGEAGKFTEQSPIVPSSPYSASKAGADLLALACHHTFGQDVIVTRCSNNYGPYQFPEKLIPLMIIKALNDQLLPVYGDGKNVRDWIPCRRPLRRARRYTFQGQAGSDLQPRWRTARW
jgi:dTDP-glucose 4,6-dehydratase